MERQGQARLPVHLTQRPSQKNTQLSTILLFLLSKQLRNRLAESHTDKLYKKRRKPLTEVSSSQDEDLQWPGVTYPTWVQAQTTMLIMLGNQIGFT